MDAGEFRLDRRRLRRRRRSSLPALKSGRSSARRVRAPACSPFSSTSSTSSARAITAGGRPGELRHMDAVGAVGGARHHLVQEDDLALPFLDPHGMQARAPAASRRARSARGSGWRTARGSGSTSCRCSTAAQAIDRPSKVAVPRPISSRMTRRAAPAWLRIAAVSTISTMKVERPRARSSAAPTRLNRRSTTPICAAAAGTKRAHLRQDGNQRVLPQERALAGHVGAGQQPEPPVVAARSQSLGDEGSGMRRISAASTTGWRPPSMPKASAVVHSWPAPARARPPVRPAPRRRSSCASAPAAAADRLGARAVTSRDQRLEQRQLERQRLVGGAERSRSRARPARRS